MLLFFHLLISKKISVKATLKSGFFVFKNYCSPTKTSIFSVGVGELSAKMTFSKY